MKGKILFLLALFYLALSPNLYSKEIPLVHKSYDGFELPAKIALPDNVKEEEVSRVVILIHGSGPNGMDMDLTAVTKDKEKNLYFKDLSDALVKKGFSVIRYDKRSYVWRSRILKDRSVLRDKGLADFQKNALEFFVEDAKSIALYAGKRFPKARVYLLGTSQGTYIALQVAHQVGEIAGVALIGFYAASISELTHEQLLWRPIFWFKRVDKNGDYKLDKEELGQDKVGTQILPQLPYLDVDKDGKISLQEIQGGNFINLTYYQKAMRAHIKYEIKAPPVTEILQKSKFKALFFQGLWDNQTAAYHAIGIRMLANFVWKKNNMRFHFFPKLGHGLDPRDRYDDVIYRKIDPEALKKVCSEMDEFFGGGEKTVKKTVKEKSK